MSCNKHPYPEEEMYVKETWGKSIIDGEFGDVGFMIYRGGYDSTKYDDKRNLLKLKCGDGWKDTYTKTVECLKYVKTKGYDCVVKTNTSNYVNVRLVLDFIASLPENDCKIYGPKILCVPNDHLCFLRGNFNIFTPKVVDDIIRTFKPKARGTDDTCISKRLYGLYGTNYYSKIVQIPEMNIDNLDYEKCGNILNFRLKGVTVGNGEIVNRGNMKKKMHSVHKKISAMKKFSIPKPKTTGDTLERVRRYRCVIGDLKTPNNIPVKKVVKKKTKNGGIPITSFFG